MRKFLTVMLVFTAFILNTHAQTIHLSNSWKFTTGDSSIYKTSTFDDSNWQNIAVGESWEMQGHANYDGFGWYRVHFLLPSAIKQKSFLKDSLMLSLGDVDDGDEVYLNGQPIGINGNGGGDDIKQGRYGRRIYKISVNNPALNWEKENLLAVRVYDSGGAGGITGSDFSIRMIDVTDELKIDTGGDMVLTGSNNFSQTIKIIPLSNKTYRGQLSISFKDPETRRKYAERFVSVQTSKSKPFTFTFKENMPMAKSYALTYTFRESTSGKALTSTIFTPYILTPKVSLQPKVNGASDYGATSGNDFLYKIPATGKQPLTYGATDLPTGLTLDEKTGIITGKTPKDGEYAVKLSVKNELGSAAKTLKIKVGNLIGLTPTLGWNSWNAWGLSVSSEKVMISAKQMADKLSRHGWSYINIDDGWEAETRAANGEIVANEKFPDMKALADSVHALGLKIGIYSSPGPKTCGGYLGSYQHEMQDAQTYAAWGIDYLKYDWCSYGDIAPNNPNLAELKKPYEVMRRELNIAKRDIIYSLCQYGMGDVWKWGASIGANSWRTTGDINDSWQSMSGIGFNQENVVKYAEPGHFNDPDMLVVGKVGWGPNLHNTRLTPDEQYTHISLWSMQAAPLLIGCDMGQLDNFTLNLLTNDEVLAINQDELGLAARQVVKTPTYQIWIKDLSDGTKAIGIFNLSEHYQTVPIDLDKMNIAKDVDCRDVWRQKDIGKLTGVANSNIPPHGVLLLKTVK
ncbi:alpha-galactosidase [Pedobacter sp. UYP30]|uniref:putative Ig domain-containing protein n=1 Tax=Pedobacter sp. UYP30 TaxID=1756400 RepID=UPI0033953DCA